MSLMIESVMLAGKDQSDGSGFIVLRMSPDAFFWWPYQGMTKYSKKIRIRYRGPPNHVNAEQYERIIGTVRSDMQLTVVPKDINDPLPQ